MVKTQKAAVSTAKTANKTVKIANLNSGAVYTLPSNGQATGASIANFIANNAAGSLANVTVQQTAFAKSLGITPANWVKHNSGMFCTNTQTRGHQLQCAMFGVQVSTINSNKSKAFKKMQLATVGGNGASNNLGHIAAAITASGGKIVTGNIASGNTLAMLLTGTNTVGNKKHAFYGKPLVQLVVTPAVKSK